MGLSRVEGFENSPSKIEGYTDNLEFVHPFSGERFTDRLLVIDRKKLLPCPLRLCSPANLLGKHNSQNS
jgi:hypothetical protein